MTKGRTASYTLVSRLGEALGPSRHLSVFAAILGLMPIGYLVVPHWSNACAYILIALGAISLLKFAAFKARPVDWLVTLTMSGPFLAVLIGQLIRGEILLPEFDSPVRLLASLTIYFLVVRLHERYSTYLFRTLYLFLVGVAISAPVIFFGVNPARTEFFGNRIATTLTDVNTLGANLSLYIPPLLIIIAYQILKDKCTTFTGTTTALTLALLTSLHVVLLLKTGSRGAYISAIIGCLAAVFFSAIVGPAKLKKRIAATSFISAVILLVGGAIFSINGIFKDRLISIPIEVFDWMSGHSNQTSGAIRLEMYSISVDLFMQNWLSGLGDRGISSGLSGLDLAGYDAIAIRDLSEIGPHSEIFARALQSGIFGLVSSIAIFLVPLVLSCKKIIEASRIQTCTEYLIVLYSFFAYSLQLFIIQFTSEPLSLKFNASFHGVLFALLLGVSSRRLSNR